MLVMMNSSGPLIDRSTCVSAAKFTIASQPLTAPATAAWILDRAVHEADVVEHVVEVLAPARIGQLVEHGHVVAVVGEPPPHERRADEAGPAANEQSHAAGIPADMYSATPSRHSGSRGTIGPQSVASTL